jgi:tight adherence protein B
MTIDPQALMSAALFIGVLLLFEGVAQLITDLRGPRRQINRRLRMLADGNHPREILESLRRRPRADAAMFRIIPGLGALDRLLLQAGVSASAGRVALWMVLLGVLLALLLRLTTALPPPPALGLAALGGIGLPVLYLVRRKLRRLRQFETQLPGALDLLVRSLRVGHPFNAALAVVAQEMPDPLGSEFGIAVDEVTYGLALDEALEHLNERIDLPDLRYLTIAVQIQHGTGGNLAEVLNGLAKVIRDRFHMFSKIRAITAEGRWSSWFLSLFPIVMLAGVQAVKPDYYTQVADHPLFAPLAAITIILLVLNVLFMRLLTKIKV